MTQDRFDIAVAGAGPAGLAAALALAGTGLSIVCAGPSAAQNSGQADTRTTALFGPSIRLLERIGVWAACLPQAAPLRALRIIDQTGRLLRAPGITFRAAEIGEETFGYNIANRHLLEALRQALAGHDRLSYRETAGVTGLAVSGGHVRLALREGDGISARLVIGADGRNSVCRQAAGISTFGWRYEQTAIACNFQHEGAHEDVCTELHCPAGPFTVVPLGDKQSSLVWVETPAAAQQLMQLDEAAFAQRIDGKLGGLLGRITGTDRRAAFPLSGLTAREYAKNRVALIGEAAHVVPPIGAQGLNLGFRDAAAIADCVAGAKAAGEDIGSGRLLSAYDTARRGDILSRTLAVDLLNRSLITPILPFQIARGLGLYLLNAIGPLRRFVMRQGMTAESDAGPSPNRKAVTRAADR